MIFNAVCAGWWNMLQVWPVTKTSVKTIGHLMLGLPGVWWNYRTRGLFIHSEIGQNQSRHFHHQTISYFKTRFLMIWKPKKLLYYIINIFYIKNINIILKHESPLHNQYKSFSQKHVRSIMIISPSKDFPNWEQKIVQLVLFFNYFLTINHWKAWPFDLLFCNVQYL